MIVDKIKKIVENNNIVKIVQTGFIENTFEIRGAICELKKDILLIHDKKSNNYIKLNINQIYELKENNNGIELFMDNDTKIKIANRVN